MSSIPGAPKYIYFYNILVTNQYSVSANSHVKLNAVLKQVCGHQNILTKLFSVRLLMFSTLMTKVCPQRVKGKFCF